MTAAALRKRHPLVYTDAKKSAVEHADDELASMPQLLDWRNQLWRMQRWTWPQNTARPGQACGFAAAGWSPVTWRVSAATSLLTCQSYKPLLILCRLYDLLCRPLHACVGLQSRLHQDRMQSTGTNYQSNIGSVGSGTDWQAAFVVKNRELHHIIYQ